MTTKHITKTTKEYFYDEKGFIVKEVITEEHHKEEIKTSDLVEAGVTTPTEALEHFKKSKGVPTITETKPVTQPYVYTKNPHGSATFTGESGATTTSFDTAKEDANVVTHNYTTINVTGKLHDDVIKQVKEVLDKQKRINPSK